jgi:hypothetical protein
METSPRIAASQTQPTPQPDRRNVDGTQTGLMHSRLSVDAASSDQRLSLTRTEAPQAQRQGTNS